MGKRKIWRGPDEAESGDRGVKTHLTTLMLMGAVVLAEQPFLLTIIYSRDLLAKVAKKEK